jgi:UDP-N-acetylmuramoyl-tripeptide--D-alanyl-D-alanine ligase
MKQVPLRQIARLLGVMSESGLQVAGYQIDSRLVGAGDLFFALRGEKVDGHRFLGQAREKGAVAAVVSLGYEGPEFGLELVRVEDVVASLQGLAGLAREKSGAVFVGVTGSVGKTTTKDFIAMLLEGKFRVGKTEGSFNSKLTLPLTVLNMAGDEEVMVLEMGMSEPGEIGRLVAIAPPDVAVLTKVAMAHVGAFEEGIAGIAKGKAEIFKDPRTKRAIFYHGLNDFPELVAAIKGEKVSFSLEDRGADYVLSLSEGLIDERGVRAYRFELPFKQPHILHNFLAAVCVARCLKVEWDEINRQMGKLQMPKMRFEQFERGGVLFVNDAYNANPESMRAALSAFPEPKSGGKRIAVLGTMVELGAFSKSSHVEVGRLAQPCVDHLLAYGEEAKDLCEAFAEVKKPAEHFNDKGALAARLKELMRPGDVVLVKASRSMQMETIFELLEG